MNDLDRNRALYKAFHDWRVRLFDRLPRIELHMLQTLRTDLLRTIEDIDQEIARRGEPTL